jgi:hypothetical protein
VGEGPWLEERANGVKSITNVSLRCWAGQNTNEV